MLEMDKQKIWWIKENNHYSNFLLFLDHTHKLDQMEFFHCYQPQTYRLCNIVVN